MGHFDKREVAYTQAKTILFHDMAQHGVARWDEHRRGEWVVTRVRELAHEFDLEEQMFKRLVGEAMSIEADTLERLYGPETGEATLP